ncbi:hypothetical protein GJ699_22600 [Duganella sp. FT80W]|uniref:Uncharacterized protein n=1 Tax=Duganella guangzhouensis TaxID=2666084 RepID=A0A6I2L4V3_9BURK|nr:hypothetical protein [Duganella guangzhouensis]MRW92793.1 hypothetical protein [Duganella guangzhouensis]
MLKMVVVVLLSSITMCAGAAPVTVSEELAQMFEADQSDRNVVPGGQLDWEAINNRDEQRELRVKQLIAAGQLATGADYYHAAMVLQHAFEPEDALLAHDLCVIAIGKGEQRAKWLAAASMDRFLMRVGRPQRYGTQFQSRMNRPPHLVAVDPNVPDAVRRELNVPTLDEAKQREAEMIKSFNDTHKAAK